MRILSRLLWFPKQLLPLRYHTNYWENGKHYHCDWNMFLGRCFNVKTREIN
jgi:hypothetical protein